MLMRFFTDEAFDGEDDVWSATQEAYRAHIDALRPSLLPAALRLATDPSVNLADGFITRLQVSVNRREVSLLVVRGVTQITLRFQGAELVPPNLYLLACAIGAEFHAGHFGRVLTTIREQEVDLHHDARMLLRLRLNPFHVFGVAFQDLGPIELAKHSERVRRPGELIQT